MIIAVAILASCNGNKSGNIVRDEDADTTVVIESLSPADELKTFRVHYLTADGIDDIKIGMSVNDIPKFIETLYSRIEPGSISDAMTIAFYEEDKETFIAYDFGEAAIDVITLSGDAVKVKSPDGDLSIGTSFMKVVNLPDVYAEWVDNEGIGTWYWRWNDLWFGVAPETINEKLSKTLYGQNTVPEADDFNENVKIGFIGTGLPF